MAYGDLNQYRLGSNVQRLPNPPKLQQPYTLSQRVTQPPRPIMPLPQSNYNTQFVNARPASAPPGPNLGQRALDATGQSIRDYGGYLTQDIQRTPVQAYNEYGGGIRGAAAAYASSLNALGNIGRRFVQGALMDNPVAQTVNQGAYDAATGFYGAATGQDLSPPQAAPQQGPSLAQPTAQQAPDSRQTSFSNADVRPGSFTTDAQGRASNPSLFGPSVRRDEFGNSLALADRFNREADTLQQNRQDQIAARDLGIDRNIATAREQRAQQDIDRLVGIGGERLAQGRLDPAALTEPTSRLQAAQQSLSGLAAQDTARRAIPGQQAQQQFENQIQSLGAQAQLQEAQAAGLAAQADLLGAQPDPGAQRTEIIQSLLDNPTLVAPEGMSQGEYIRSLADEILSSGGINQQDISTLRNDPSPEAIAEFNSLYGPGAAQRYLNG